MADSSDDAVTELVECFYAVIDPHSRYSVSVDTGHRTISPGVRRQIDAAINLCDTDCKED